MGAPATGVPAREKRALRRNSWFLLSVLTVSACMTGWLLLLVSEQSSIISMQEAMLREFRNSGSVETLQGKTEVLKRLPRVLLNSSRERSALGQLERRKSRRWQRMRQETSMRVSRISVVDPRDSPNRIQYRYRDPAGRPTLESLVSRYNNTILNASAVQFLLQIAIIGFGKCGTTSLMHWLGSHPEIDCLMQEVWVLMHGRPSELVRHLYLGLPPRTNETYIQRCYKCPGDIMQRHILDYYHTYWPETKLFIGIRHPYEWFKSLVRLGSVFRVHFDLNQNCLLTCSRTLLAALFHTCSFLYMNSTTFEFKICRLIKR